jgi:hypothetical protein
LVLVMKFAVIIVRARFTTNALKVGLPILKVLPVESKQPRSDHFFQNDVNPIL